MVPQDGVRLFPRRKAQDNGKSPQQERSSTTRNGRAPMVLSLDDIVPLFDLPQAQAAQRLGVALTSLKVVCRKLGVDRWPYLRGSKAARARVAGASAAGMKKTKTQQEPAMREDVNDNYHHIGCTLPGRSGPLDSTSSEGDMEAPYFPLRKYAPSSGGASRAATEAERQRVDTSRENVWGAHVPQTSEPISTLSSETADSMRPASALSSESAYSGLREWDVDKHYFDREVVELEPAPSAGLLDRPATRSFSLDDTPASHWQSSIPSAAEGSLSAHFLRSAPPMVHGAHVKPPARAQRSPDAPAEPRAGLSCLLTSGRTHQSRKQPGAPGAGCSGYVIDADQPAYMSSMMSSESSDDLRWLLCNSDPLAGDILRKQFWG